MTAQLWWLAWRGGLGHRLLLVRNPTRAPYRSFAGLAEGAVLISEALRPSDAARSIRRGLPASPPRKAAPRATPR